MVSRHCDKREQGAGRESGSTVVEFCLVAAIWVPVLLFFAQLGLDSLRALISAQVCRDAGHMYAYGIDFRLAQNQGLLGKMAGPLNLSATSGDGSLLLSSITWVTADTCTQAGLNSCPNAGHYAFTSFVHYGSTDADVFRTALGNPPAGYMTGATAFGNNDFMTNTQLQADGLTPYLTLPNESGQVVFVSELTMRAQMMGGQSKGSYVRSIF